MKIVKALAEANNQFWLQDIKKSRFKLKYNIFKKLAKKIASFFLPLPTIKLSNSKNKANILTVNRLNHQKASGFSMFFENNFDIKSF